MNAQQIKKAAKTWTDIALAYLKADVVKEIKAAEKELAKLRRLEAILDAEHNRRCDAE